MKNMIDSSRSVTAEPRTSFERYKIIFLTILSYYFSDIMDFLDFYTADSSNDTSYASDSASSEDVDVTTYEVDDIVPLHIQLELLHNAHTLTFERNNLSQNLNAEAVVAGLNLANAETQDAYPFSQDFANAVLSAPTPIQNAVVDTSYAARADVSNLNVSCVTHNPTADDDEEQLDTANFNLYPASDGRLIRIYVKKTTTVKLPELNYLSNNELICRVYNITQLFFTSQHTIATCIHSHNTCSTMCRP